MTERTVYVEEAGSVIHLPREHYTFNEARQEAAAHARMEDPGWGRARCLGKRDVRLHDHAEPWDECEQGCGAVPTWTFETYEGTYRD